MLHQLAKLLLIPLLWVVPLIYLWSADRLSWVHVELAALALTLAYWVFQAVRYGLIGPAPQVKEILLPQVTYYFKQYQGNFREARSLFLAEISPSARRILEFDAAILSLYFDSPFILQDMASARFAVGFALVDGEDDTAALEILEGLGCEKAVLPECRIASISLRVLDSLSYIVAAIRCIRPLWAYVDRYYRQMWLEMHEVPMVEWIRRGTIRYGALVGDSKRAFRLSKYPTPRRNAKAELEFDRRRRELESDKTS